MTYKNLVFLIEVKEGFSQLKDFLDTLQLEEGVYLAKDSGYGYEPMSSDAMILDYFGIDLPKVLEENGQLQKFLKTVTPIELQVKYGLMEEE